MRVKLFRIKEPEGLIVPSCSRRCKVQVVFMNSLLYGSVQNEYLLIWKQSVRQIKLQTPNFLRDFCTSFSYNINQMHIFVTTLYIQKYVNVHILSSAFVLGLFFLLWAKMETLMLQHTVTFKTSGSQPEKKRNHCFRQKYTFNFVATVWGNPVQTEMVFPCLFGGTWLLSTEV